MLFIGILKPILLTLYDIAFPLQLESARPLRTTPLHDRLKDRGACFGETAGWERANWFAPESIKKDTSIVLVSKIGLSMPIKSIWLQEKKLLFLTRLLLQNIWCKEKMPCNYWIKFAVVG